MGKTSNKDIYPLIIFLLLPLLIILHGGIIFLIEIIVRSFNSGAKVAHNIGKTSEAWAMLQFNCTFVKPNQHHGKACDYL